MYVFSDGDLAVVPKITSFLEEPLMYNESEEHKANIQDFEPENKGYNPTKAYELFKKVYNHLFDADKQKTVEIEFLFAKTQEERVNLARFVKNQLKNCFNQEGKKVEIKVNVVAEWNNFLTIAIALANEAKILICDEPTTALDVSVQKKILYLIKKLQQEKKFSIIFITHDLEVVKYVADRIAVIYAGRIFEYGTTHEVFIIVNIPILGLF
ncbi:ABC transporter ATP-binding protein [Maize bushy stunt phytoplasma]|uniref:ABC transporter ATP-binding protein n=1 Tax=Maize bushy stunt phytoplasma TaxID=202462 RepID=UPI00083CEF95|nr:ABC transporter ATP-binding protein [Maize bushy stunt phytoplasma]